MASTLYTFERELVTCLARHNHCYGPPPSSLRQVSPRPQSALTPPGPHDQVTTLRVRLDAGERPLLLKMRFADTVGDLAMVVARHLNVSADDFELRTAFPNRAYADVSETLEEAGLVPNATLMLRKF